MAVEVTVEVAGVQMIKSFHYGEFSVFVPGVLEYFLYCDDLTCFFYFRLIG